ncbi:MAG TPA: hypothetical protein VGX51_13195 [Solirubrobacteraceae bacterium]|jgi:hypothetical protein|nr:hypothetical protein [Solirubrobacteraceae bacterium]
MSYATRLVAKVTVAGAAVAVLAIGASPASAENSLTVPLKNWAVYGELTAKKLNEQVVLPKGSTLNGEAVLTSLGLENGKEEQIGTIKGKLFVPPFKAPLKIAGVGTLVDASADIKITQVGEAEGTISEVPLPQCTNSWVGLDCLVVTVNSLANLDLTAAGVAGVEVPTNCETTEPILLPIKAMLTSAELVFETHASGLATIPPFKCEGLQGPVVATALDLLLAGPENPFKLGLAPHEPAPPLIEQESASSVSQISAKLHGSAIPNGEPMTDCHFELGTSTEYGTSIPCEPQPRKSQVYQAKPRIVFVPGLQENKTYHYRLVATNSLGTADGPDTTFTTLGRAGEPEFGQCTAQKGGLYRDGTCLTKKGKGKFEWKPGPAPTCIAKKKGQYSDASCTVKAAKPSQGKFEKQAGPKFTSTSGPLTLEVGGHKVTCAAGTGTGEVATATTAPERITFTGCETSGKKCTSEGTDSTPSGSAGAIETNDLTTRLLGPVEGHVWADLTSAEHEPYLAEFGCEGVRLRIKGSLGGVQFGDVGAPSATGNTSFGAGEGEQALVGEVSENGGSSWSAGGATTAALALTSTFELATEIRP